MRLVDADAFKAEGRELYREAGWDLREVHYSQLDTECNIDMMPTIEAVPLEDYRSMEQTVYKLTQALAEAEPVKHGRWIVISEYPKKAECSSCGYPIEHELVCWWDYCPNCGARVDASTMGQVKHGHWVKYGSPLFSEWECSECGERHTGNDLPDKCPYCGAIMDLTE